MNPTDGRPPGEHPAGEGRADGRRPEAARADGELQAWMGAWQSGPGPGPEVRRALQRRVRRRSLGLKALAAGEVLFAAAMLAFLLRIAAFSRRLPDTLAMLALALLVVGAVGWSLWNRRGLWRPSAETSRAYLALSLARCRRRLRGLRFGWVLLAAEVAVFLPWIGWRIWREGPADPVLASYLWGYLLLVLLVGVAAVVLALLARYSRRELRALEELEVAMEGEDARTGGEEGAAEPG